MQNKGTFTLRRIFPSLGDEDLAKLQEHSSVIALRKGKNLFVGGDAPRSIYAVAKGCLKVVRETSEGQSVIIQVVKAGDIIGVHEVFGEYTYTRTAVTLRDSEIFAIDSREIMDLVLRVPSISLQFLRLFCNDLSRMEKRLEFDLFKPARTRVAWVLYELYQTFAEEGELTFEPPLSRRDIAEMADVAPETVSRALAEFKTAGILESQGPVFRVLDLSALQNEAEER